MYKNIGIISLVVLLALAIGLIFGANWNKNNNTNQPTNSTETVSDTEDSNSTSGKDVNSLIRYTLPNGWSESTCPSSSGSIYFQPNGAPKVDCGNNPELSVVMSASDQNITECSQIQDVKDVKKHICKSLFINDLRSLVAETEYLSSSIYERDTSVKTYYIDSGSGIVKVQYTSASGNQYLNSFDELVNSISAK